ncbi:MAG: sigma-70 family RNA polymerase sigma factor [Eubacteriaceae bacterium]|nr:sigma-70 family RNA polymerase sigma factor [Eubacteriaceae bacterium]
MGENNKEIYKDARRAFELYGDMVYRLALVRTRKQVDAEDIVQDVFLRYLKSAPDKMDPEHEKAWLIKVAVNRTKSLATLAWNRKVALSDIALAGSGEDGLPSEVYMAVMGLPQKYRTAIHLYYYEGYTTSQIAGLLLAKEATVRSWLSRGREILRKSIEMDDEVLDDVC